jgi:molybdopterin/thiamine biosynthesis adenylyltransferase
MTDLTLIASDVTALRSNLIGHTDERCAILFTTAAKAAGNDRLLSREVEFPEFTDYASSGPLEAELKPGFVARITKRARREEMGLVFVHSHPGDNPPLFSDVDTVGENRLAAFLAHRLPGTTHAALVVSAGGMRARRLGTKEDIRVISIGSVREILFETRPTIQSDLSIYDRQTRLLGERGQRILGSMKIAIVGLGGTGSLIAQELVHLGIRTFTLVDADTIEVSNLNRVAEAVAKDIGTAKVEIAARYISRFSSEATIECIRGDVMHTDVARRLLDADMIFGCTDSHGSRSVLQQVAYQYMIPCIDMGVIVAASEARILHVYGRVQLLAPGLACLTCGGLLDPDEVRRDMMTEFERRADPYVPGSQDPAPAVMSLNATVASLATTMMLAVVAAFPSNARHLLYNAMASKLRSVSGESQESCYICSRSGALARGDSWPLFARSS